MAGACPKSPSCQKASFSFRDPYRGREGGGALQAPSRGASGRTKGTTLTPSEGSFPGGLRSPPSPPWAFSPITTMHPCVLFDSGAQAEILTQFLLCARLCGELGDTAVTEADGPALLRSQMVIRPTEQSPAPGSESSGRGPRGAGRRTQGNLSRQGLLPPVRGVWPPGSSMGEQEKSR